MTQPLKDNVPLSQPFACPNCPGVPDAYVVDDYRTGDQVCTGCGMVIQERCIDPKNEWRNVGDGVDKSRVGSSEDSLSTSLPSTTCDSYEYRGRQKSPFLSKSFDDIEHIAGRMHLPHCIVKMAKGMIVFLHENRRCNRRNAIATAAVYEACLQEGAPRTARELAAITQVTINQIFSARKLLTQMLGMGSISSHIKCKDVIPRVCCNLELSPQVAKLASHLATEIESRNLLDGHTTAGIMGAAIIVACRLLKVYLDQNAVSDAVCCGLGTIKNSLKVLGDNLKSLLPPKFLKTLRQQHLSRRLRINQEQAKKRRGKTAELPHEYLQGQESDQGQFSQKHDENKEQDRESPETPKQLIDGHSKIQEQPNDDFLQPQMEPKQIDTKCWEEIDHEHLQYRAQIDTEDFQHQEQADQGGCQHQKQPDQGGCQHQKQPSLDRSLHEEKTDYDHFQTQEQSDQSSCQNQGQPDLDRSLDQKQPGQYHSQLQEQDDQVDCQYQGQPDLDRSLHQEKPY
ncbi:transcription initiation factor IIB-like [Oratosquilla oratoria]|uniref:transcription initiation factor IIB-like n=1 Tax=Oratosquilla oratoria TaxID=337810 RepID=UPI003F769632